MPQCAGKTAGVIGTGKIGSIVARLLWHLRCNVICYDMHPNQHLLDLGAKYVSLDDLISQSMIISLNCPLTEETYHLINEQSISKMKDGVMIVNTGRGALVDSAAVLQVRARPAHVVVPACCLLVFIPNKQSWQSSDFWGELTKCTAGGTRPPSPLGGATALDPASPPRLHTSGYQSAGCWLSSRTNRPEKSVLDLG